MPVQHDQNQHAQKESINNQQESKSSQQEGQKKINKTGIPDRLKAVVEHFSGFSLDEVRVHYNSDKPALMNAHAYAEGLNIYIGPGQEKHLAHEVWHVVQQMKGDVKATKEVNGVGINDNKGLEKDAASMGIKASKTKEMATQETNMPLLNKDVSNGVPQLVEKTTMGGTFSTNEYKVEVKEGGTDAIDRGTHAVTGIMDLQFDAAASIDSPSIGLIQTTTPTVKKADASRETYAAGRSENRSLTTTVKEEEVDKSLYLDRQGGNLSPVFGAKNPTDLTDSTALEPESFHDGYKDKTGKHILDELGHVKEEAPAKLNDTPGRDWKDGWDVQQSFETTALCLSGPMKGTYLGSIEWGYDVKAAATAAGAPEATVMPMKKVKEMVPTNNFMKAAEAWNSDTTNVDGTDHNMIQIPLVEGVDATSHAELVTSEQVVQAMKTLMGGDDDALVKRNKAQLLQMRYFELASSFDEAGALRALDELTAIGDQIPVLEKAHLEKGVWKKLDTLLPADNIPFAQKWITLYETQLRYKTALIAVRDKQLEKEGDQWSVEDDVLKKVYGTDISAEDLATNEVTAANIAKVYLGDETMGVVLLCLNEAFIANDAWKKGTVFTAPKI